MLAAIGDLDHPFRLASISKPILSWAIAQCVEDGSVSWDDAVAPATLRHLLTHASGLAFDVPVQVAAPGTRRTYSNEAYQRAADHTAECTGIPVADLLAEGIFRPLAMTSSSLLGHPGAFVWSTMHDLIRFVAEVWQPRLIATATASEMLTEQFPGIGGVLPGVGTFRPNPWGIGFELRGAKHPHWTGETNSTETFGHFGGAGTFCWWDPALGVALIGLGDREFDAWALTDWPRLSDAVIGSLAP